MAQSAGGTLMAHELPALPYDYAALEPTIDEKTMHLHHDMHHAAYVKNLNAALEKHPNLQSKSAEDLIRDLNAVPEDIRAAVRNNGGGHVNHTMRGPGITPSLIAFFTSTSAYPAPSVSRSRIVVNPYSSARRAFTVARIVRYSVDSFSNCSS